MSSGRDAWVLSTREFGLLWEAEPVRAPFPVAFASGAAERFAGADDERRAQTRLVGELAAASSRMTRSAMRALCAPRCCIQMIGAYAGGDGRPVRVHAYSAHRVDDEPVFLAVQEQSDLPGVGGAVSITAHAVSEWGAALVSLLPVGVAAGSLPADDAIPVCSVQRDELRYRCVGSRASAATAAAAFAHREPVLGAHFLVSAGSLADGRTPTTVEIHVADLPGDGRYAMVLEDPGSARGVTARRLAALLGNAVTLARRRHDSVVSA